MTSTLPMPAEFAPQDWLWIAFPHRADLWEEFTVPAQEQIAAYAKEHFSVQKTVIGGRTETVVERLDPAGRVRELARMMGGRIITETTQRHAQELLACAGRGKNRNKRG